MVAGAHQEVERREVGIEGGVLRPIEPAGVDREPANLSEQAPRRIELVGDAGHRLVGEIAVGLEAAEIILVHVEVRDAEAAADIGLDLPARAHRIELVEGIQHERV